jgi:hypothetical protein
MPSSPDDNARRHSVVAGTSVTSGDSHQTLGYYLDLCDWLGFWDCCDVLKRRIAASPEGDRTLCKTQHADMMTALFDAHIKNLIARGEARFVERDPEERSEAEGDNWGTGDDWQEADDDL